MLQKVKQPNIWYVVIALTLLLALSMYNFSLVNQIDNRHPCTICMESGYNVIGTEMPQKSIEFNTNTLPSEDVKKPDPYRPPEESNDTFTNGVPNWI